MAVNKSCGTTWDSSVGLDPMLPLFKMAILAFCGISIILLTACQAADLPPHFPRCHIDDPELNKCLKEATKIVRPYIGKGIPDLDLVQLEPLIIPKIEMQQGTAALNYKVTLVNATIHGMTDYEFSEFAYDREALIFRGTSLFKQLVMTSQYDIDGKILLAPIQGNGQLNITLGPSKGSLVITGKIVQRNGEKYYDPLSVKATIEISNATLQVDGLFGGNEELSKEITDLLKEHSDELLKEVIPAIEKVAEDLIMKMLKGINKKISYEKLLPSLH